MRAGLLLIRQKRYADAVMALGKAASLAPDNARYAYVYAVALQETGKPAEALAVLEQAHQAHPGDANILMALASGSLQQGDRESALRYTQDLARLAPDDPNVRQLQQALGIVGPEPALQLPNRSSWPSSRGGRKRSVRCGSWRRSKPCAARALAKRCAISSANTPPPRMPAAEAGVVQPAVAALPDQRQHVPRPRR